MVAFLYIVICEKISHMFKVFACGSILVCASQTIALYEPQIASITR